MSDILIDLLCYFVNNNYKSNSFSYLYSKSYIDQSGKITTKGIEILKSFYSEKKLNQLKQNNFVF